MAHRHRVPCLIAALLSVVGVFGCSSQVDAVEPIIPPTLFVTNPLCDGSECRPVSLWAFILKFTTPTPVTGHKRLGDVPGTTACLSFPETWKWIVRQVDSDGAVIDADTMIWTPGDALLLSVWDSVGYWPLAQTETFTPGEAEGWDLTFTPDSSQTLLWFQSHLSPGERCTQF